MQQVILDVWHGVELEKRIGLLKNWCSWNLHGQGSANTETVDGGGSFLSTVKPRENRSHLGCRCIVLY